MITLKDIFGTLGVVFILFGCFIEYNGLPIGDTLIKSGFAILVLMFLVSVIRIPENSRGTPMGRGLANRKFKST